MALDRVAEKLMAAKKLIWEQQVSHIIHQGGSGLHQEPPILYGKTIKWKIIMVACGTPLWKMAMGAAQGRRSWQAGQYLINRGIKLQVSQISHECIDPNKVLQGWSFLHQRSK